MLCIDTVKNILYRYPIIYPYVNLCVYILESNITMWHHSENVILDICVKKLHC